MAPAIARKGKAKAKAIPVSSVSKGINRKKIVITPKPKRTSIGGSHMPLNKHKRRNWKAYRGQGRPL